MSDDELPWHLIRCKQIPDKHLTGIRMTFCASKDNGIFYCYAIPEAQARALYEGARKILDSEDGMNKADHKLYEDGISLLRKGIGK